MCSREARTERLAAANAGTAAEQRPSVFFSYPVPCLFNRYHVSLAIYSCRPSRIRTGGESGIRRLRAGGRLTPVRNLGPFFANACLSRFKEKNINRETK